MGKNRHFGELRFCACMGPAFLVVFLVSWGAFGGFVPPFAGNTPAEVVAENFRTEVNSIRFGMAMAMIFSFLYLIWALAVSRVMDYCLDESDSLISRLQVWGAGFTAISLIVFCSIILGAAYRPEAVDSSDLQLFYDFAWAFLDLTFFPTTVQMCAMSIAFLRDPRTPKLVPKWLSWYGIWVGLMFFAEIAMPFVKSGPFDRAGLLNFWIEFPIWFVWILCLSYFLMKAIGRIESEPLPKSLRE